VDVRHRLPQLKAIDASPFQLCHRYEDIRWLTGFTGSTAVLLVDKRDGTGHLIVDGRYLERAEDEIRRSNSPTSVHLINGATTVDDEIASIVGDCQVGVDGTHITAAQLVRLQSKMTVVLEDTPLDQLRRVKDSNEIELIDAAAQIAAHALNALLEDGLIGRSERDVRNQLDHLMRMGGADDVGFDTIVATGANAARPHHEPSDTRIENGHMVVIDFGAELQGYRSDMTRTVCVGNVSTELRGMFEIVREAQAAGVSAVRAGVAGSEIDGAVRKVFAREGVEHEYVHGTGHGIGLFIHEPPIFSPRCDMVLGVNEVVTVEPGLYRKGVGGVRIEDLVVVSDKNCRTLTNTPKDLICPRSPQTI
jgi:Xaa-Pro aminopeptidase